MAARKKLAIIDGKSVFYRGYYALPNLSTKDGTPTGGVYGFSVMALELIKKLKPDYVAVAWDKPKTNIRARLKLDPNYKAGRKPAPPDFYDQVPILHELLDAFGWPLYELDDYEADDIMGTLAMQAREKDIETMLITSDLDALQLINGHVHVYALKRGFSNIELFRPETFILKYGITPEQFLDLKALKGDSSDNIPGVPGIGEKTALELLKQYKTLENVYKNLDQIKETTRKKLEAGKESAFLSKKLAAIWTDAPIKLNLKEVDGRRVQPEKIQQLFQKLEFRTLANQLPQVMKVAETAQPKAGVAQVHKINGGETTIIDTGDALDALDLKQAKSLLIHSRAAGKHGKNPQLLILSPDAKHTYVLDLAKLKTEHVKKALEPQLASAKLIGYDVKSSLKVLLGLGIDLPEVEHDVLVGAFLINPLIRSQSLTDLASSELGYDGSSLDDLPAEDLRERASEIIAVIHTLEQRQSEQMSELTGLIKVAQDIEWPVIPVLARMEYTGIELDTNYLKEMSVRVEKRIKELEKQIYKQAGQEFNIGSPAQLAEILYTKLKLPTAGIKKGKTGYSTAASELDKLRGAHPIIDLITAYREVTKLKNTYIDTLPAQVDENSRLHTTFSLTIAPTGRLSSSDPNLQNIPVRTDLGREIRTAFVAGPEQVLISADYSQFELRLAAYLSKDERLIEMFNKDVDVHTATAAEVYGRQEQDVTKNMRRDAKAVNFGIMYGLGPHGLTQNTGMTYEAAKKFIEKYFQIRPKLLEYIKSIREQADKKGFVETMYGRRRPTPDVHSSNFAVREAAYRQAINMPLQGSAADIMKMAMVEVDKKLTGTDSKLLLQIHDSILVETPRSGADKVAKLLKETMENVVKLPIKLTVDTEIGKNWGEL
jgi:DNA polymerase-1